MFVSELKFENIDHQFLYNLNLTNCVKRILLIFMISKVSGVIGLHTTTIATYTVDLVHFQFSMSRFLRQFNIEQ